MIAFKFCDGFRVSKVLVMMSRKVAFAFAPQNKESHLLKERRHLIMSISGSHEIFYSCSVCSESLLAAPGHVGKPFKCPYVACGANATVSEPITKCSFIWCVFVASGASCFFGGESNSGLAVSRISVDVSFVDQPPAAAPPPPPAAAAAAAVANNANDDEEDVEDMEEEEEEEAGPAAQLPQIEDLKARWTESDLTVLTKAWIAAALEGRVRAEQFWAKIGGKFHGSGCMLTFFEFLQ